MNEELDAFIHQTLLNFMDENYKISNDEKWTEVRGHNHIVRISVNSNHILAVTWADTLRDDNYFVFEYIKDTKQIFASGNYKPFAKHFENIFTLDCLGAL